MKSSGRKWTGPSKASQSISCYLQELLPEQWASNIRVSARTVGQAMHRSLAKIHSQGEGYFLFHFILICVCFSAPWSISRSGSNLNTCEVETIATHHWEGRDSTNTQSKQDLEKNQGSAYLGGHSLPSAGILVIMPQTFLSLCSKFQVSLGTGWTGCPLSLGHSCHSVDLWFTEHTPFYLVIYIPFWWNLASGTPLQYSCLENPMDRGAW